MKDGDYIGHPFVAKVSKLRQTIAVARSLDRYLNAQASPGPPFTLSPAAIRIRGSFLTAFKFSASMER
ncbi:MAG: hypothetical protein JWL61_2118 [Gemmatimonadetes bacterium]|nr:hypothetical protein [Gemmatimonadota bacterium]